MSRLKKKYANGQSRGGNPGTATFTGRSNPKDYHRQEVAFHGGEMAFEKWRDGGRKGYGSGG